MRRVRTETLFLSIALSHHLDHLVDRLIEVETARFAEAPS